MLTVSVSEHCLAVAYNSQDLQDQATRIMTSYALQQLGTRYTLFETTQIHILRASFTNQKAQIAQIALTEQGTWVYQFTPTDETQIMKLLEGRNRQDAINLLSIFPGIKHISIVGVKDDNPLPTDPTRIHLALFYGAL
jgi:VCBS repeat-containing protein